MNDNHEPIYSVLTKGAPCSFIDGDPDSGWFACQRDERVKVEVVGSQCVSFYSFGECRNGNTVVDYYNQGSGYCYPGSWQIQGYPNPCDFPECSSIC